MTPDKPTAAEMKVDLENMPLSAFSEYVVWKMQVAAKRAQYAEHAVRELLAALQNESDRHGHLLECSTDEVLAKYQGIYVERQI